MPTSCCAPGCTNRFIKQSGIGFFRFPRTTDRRNRWRVAMKRTCVKDKTKTWDPAEHDRVCGKHFISGKPVDDDDHPDYVPSIFIFLPVRQSTPTKIGRYNRVKQRSRQVLQTLDEEIHQEQNRDVAANALMDLSQSICTTFTDTGTDPIPEEKCPLQEEFHELQMKYSQLQAEYQRVLDHNRELQEEIQKKKFSFTNLDNAKISALTGICSMAAFMWVLSLVTLCIKRIGNVSPGDQLLLVLMKLRLNLTNRDLALRFNICPTQVSKILGQSIPVFAKKLKFLIKWPDKNTILKNLPKAFKRNYKKCRVVIDCSEIFLQRPSNLDARAKTWSNYKHHNTLKFLIGITPYGSVSFLSECWGGRVSDKEITEKSGFYNKLEYGDLVLADRGFLIEEELAIHGASLAIPPFTRGKKQLSQREIEYSRRLSRARIHVERAIERIKNYQIIKHTMPISLSKHANDILIICGALTNLMPKLVN